MIKLVGEKLRQYDLNRTVEITPTNGRTVEMVRFIRGRKPYMLAHREEGGKIIADIPNVLLKSFGAVKCIVTYVDADGHTVTENQSFYVRKRDMPAGYSYTETDTLELGEGGGSTSKYKQPDWGVEENGVLFPETALEINPDMGVAVIMTPFTNLPEDGKTYTVNYNGGAYECIATFTKSGDDYVYALGNGAAMGLDTPASDAPFLLMAATNESALAQQGIYGLFLMLDGLESCVLSVNGNLVHPIPDDLVAGKGVYYVDITMDGNGSFALSSTVKKIIAAAQQGKMVCASIDGAETVLLSRYSEAGVVFQHMVCGDDGRVYLHNYECLATGINVYRNINLV